MPALNPTIQAYQATGVAGGASYQYASLNELAFGAYGRTAVNQPEFIQNVYGKYFRLYGDGIRLTTFLRAAGLLIEDWTSSRYTVFEEPGSEQTVTLHANITAGAAGAALNFEITAADRAYLREGASLYLPGEYFSDGRTTPKEYRVHTYDPSNGQGSLRPFSGTSDLDVNIPAGTKLTVGGFKFGRGGGQPGSLVSTNLQRDFYPTILAESFSFEGGVNTFKPALGVIDSNGNKTVFANGLWNMELRFDRSMDKVIWISERNTNMANVTTLDRNGTAKYVESFDGVRNQLDARAQELPHDGGLEPQDMAILRQINESQGVTATMSAGFFGPRLWEKIQDAGFEFIKEYSGRQELLDNLNTLGGSVKVIDLYGHKMIAMELATFKDFTSFGNSAYRMPNEGFITPLGYVNGKGKDGETVTLPNLGLAYRKGNNEDRTNMFGVVAGVNGMGYATVDQFDSSNVYMKSEFGIVMLGVNQMVNVVDASR